MSDKKFSFTEEIERRRTFAIISHPDAGKTTLTEKFLLYGGAIREAGSVKARRAAKYAVSDWMEIEKQRGISVTSSVLQFEYNNYCVNILDTPGHQDFSEDTYRTLMAADSAVMVIDCSKGVEEQTKKLFQVCKMSGIPIFTFINKMDRQGKDPFELLEDIENVLGIRSCPMNWPIGQGKEFKGVYHRKSKEIELFDGTNHGQSQGKVVKVNIGDEKLSDLIGEGLHKQLTNDIELLDVAGDNFDHEQILKGELTPVFFGSALTNFGVESFLKSFLTLTTPPKAHDSNLGKIDPASDNFSGFIFKIQANMDPSHRDRIAFMRICSGKFEKGMMVNHVQKNKKVKLAQPQQFLAQNREIVDVAYPGDIIGIHDPGDFNIGDTLCQDNSKLQYKGIPRFAPGFFSRISIVNSLKRKQFIKGITQLSEEGAIQVFRIPHMALEELIIGAVGVLQFDVLEYRLKNEYGVDVKMERLPYHYIRWIKMDNFDYGTFNTAMDTKLIEDKDENPVILFENEWSIRTVEERNKDAVLKETSM